MTTTGHLRRRTLRAVIQICRILPIKVFLAATVQWFPRDKGAKLVECTIDAQRRRRHATLHEISLPFPSSGRLFPVVDVSIEDVAVGSISMRRNLGRLTLRLKTFPVENSPARHSSESSIAIIGTGNYFASSIDPFPRE